MAVSIQDKSANTIIVDDEARSDPLPPQAVVDDEARSDPSPLQVAMDKAAPMASHSVGQFAMYRKQHAPGPGVTTVASIRKKLAQGVIVPRKIEQGAAQAAFNSKVRMTLAEKAKKKKALERKRKVEKKNKRRK